MAPSTIEFESSGNDKQISNQAWALCNKYPVVVTEEDTFVPRLLLVLPKEVHPEPILVFDPPPMAA